MTPEDRFWSKVDKAGDCWTWVASRNSGGRYGQFSINGRSRTAHRVAWFLTTGEWPGDWVVCHRCDNTLCVRPAHLFLGTQADNLRDMRTKGRGTDWTRNAKGTQKRNAKLTEAVIPEIRARHAAGETQRDLAREFGVDPSTIRLAVTRTTWKHVA